MTEFGPDLLESADLLRQVLDVLPVGIWITDCDGVISYGNPASRNIWKGIRYVGLDQYDVYKGWWRGSGKRIEPHEWAAARAVARGETSHNEEIEIECFDGTRKVILVSGVPLRAESGEILGCVVVHVDISSRIALEDRLQLALDTDPLTRADSRRRFYETLNAEVARANRYQRPLSLAMFDIDRFKEINDRYGHLIGDHVLQRTGELVNRQLREGAHLARFGGDEFMVVLPEARLADAVRTVERLRQLLAENPFDEAGSVTFSFGVCEYESGESIDSFIRRADRALYEAKATGRNRVSAGRLPEV